MRVLLFNVAFYLGAFLVAMTAWLLARFGTQDQIRRLIAWYARCVFGMIRLLLDGRIEVRGLDRLPPGGPQVIAPKHQSELDVFVIFEQFPDLSAIVMAELEKYPFFGAFIRKLDLITVSVDGGPQGRTQMVVDGAVAARAQGRPVLIYPEGTLMSLGAKERYRAGVWRIHEATGAVVTPVAQSLGAIWPRREWRKRIGRTGVVEYLDPMPMGLDQETFTAELERRIETATMALIRETAAADDVAAAEDRHARGVANED